VLDCELGLKVTQRITQEDRIPDAVRHIHSRDTGAYIWTEDLKARIEDAMRSSNDFEEYQNHLANLGVEADPRGSGGKFTYRFVDQQGKQRQCREKRLGAAYERERIEEKFWSFGHPIERNRFKPQSSESEYHLPKRSETHPRGTEIFADGNERVMRRDDVDPRDALQHDFSSGHRSDKPYRSDAAPVHSGNDAHGQRNTSEDNYREIRRIGAELIQSSGAQDLVLSDTDSNLRTNHTRLRNGHEGTTTKNPQDTPDSTTGHVGHDRYISGPGAGMCLDGAQTLVRPSDSFRRLLTDLHGLSTGSADQKEQQEIIARWRNGQLSQATRGTKPIPDRRSSENDERRGYRVYETYQYGLVQAFCIARAGSSRRYEEAHAASRNLLASFSEGVREVIERAKQSFHEHLEHAHSRICIMLGKFGVRTERFHEEALCLFKQREQEKVIAQEQTQARQERERTMAKVQKQIDNQVKPLATVEREQSHARDIDIDIGF
jgi:hypothetical protein